jgi:hypothetical protein
MDDAESSMRGTIRDAINRELHRHLQELTEEQTREVLNTKEARALVERIIATELLAFCAKIREVDSNGPR